MEKLSRAISWPGIQGITDVTHHHGDVCTRLEEAAAHQRSDVYPIRSLFHVSIKKKPHDSIYIVQGCIHIFCIHELSSSENSVTV